jgi:acetyltransferase-like isoleucine patch superfamily enzyme
MHPFHKRFLSSDDLADVGFAALGRHVLIHETANIVGIQNITIRDHVRIDEFISIKAAKPVTIGSYVHIGGYSYIGAGEPIELCDFVGLSQGVKIYTVSDDYSGASLTNPTVPERYLSLKRGAVVLERHVIIGAGTVILPKVVIGEGSSVGALSLVSSDLAEWGVYCGVPARRLRERKRDLLAIEDRLRSETALR